MYPSSLKKCSCEIIYSVCSKKQTQSSAQSLARGDNRMINCMQGLNDVESHIQLFVDDKKECYKQPPSSSTYIIHLLYFSKGWVGLSSNSGSILHKMPDLSHAGKFKLEQGRYKLHVFEFCRNF